MHRYGASLSSRARMFQVAWVSFALTKFVAFVYTIFSLRDSCKRPFRSGCESEAVKSALTRRFVVVAGEKAPMGWNVFMVFVNVGVSITQVYSTIVLRVLSSRMSAQKQKAEIDDTLRSLQKKIETEQLQGEADLEASRISPPPPEHPALGKEGRVPAETEGLVAKADGLEPEPMQQNYVA